MDILTAEGVDVDGLWSRDERVRVARLCALITGDPSAAEDLAQETLLQAWQIRHRLTEPSGRGPWLDAIARHVCRRWLASRGRLRGLELITDRPSEMPGVCEAGGDELAELLEREELGDLLERALGLLPPETRGALVARYVEELGPQEIAARLGVSPDAVSMRLTRGRARIRELLETDLADEPLAQVWVGRHGVAWRATRLSCPTCGRPGTSMRRDARAAVVELRCDVCQPDGLAAVWRLDNPELARHLAAVQRPSAVVHRMAAWSFGWWPRAIEAGRVPCTRCGAEVHVAPYERPEIREPHTRFGWHASCASCGEVLTTSLLGLALACPETRRLRDLRPRAHAVPTKRAQSGGRPVLIVGVHDDASGDSVSVAFDEQTMRFLAVVDR
jgi:RNA polymerase sigma factor (sigma-70 family)